MTPARLKALGLLSTLFLAGVAAPHPVRAEESAAKDPYGDWIGTLVRDQGTDCPTEGTSLMQIQNGRMIFVPETGTLVLRGVPDKARQHYHAQLVLQDARKQPLPLVFEAHPNGAVFEGVYGTPNCRAHVTLHRPQSRSWKNFMGED